MRRGPWSQGGSEDEAAQTHRKSGWLRQEEHAVRQRPCSKGTWPETRTEKGLEHTTGEKGWQKSWGGGKVWVLPQPEGRRSCKHMGW